MCTDYIFTCTVCKYSWELLGDGLFVIDLNNLDIRCSKCGCQVLDVNDTAGSGKASEQKDFTEQNKALVEKNENSFYEVKSAFEKLSMLTEGSSEYEDMKNWILKRIKWK